MVIVRGLDLDAFWIRIILDHLRPLKIKYTNSYPKFAFLQKSKHQIIDYIFGYFSNSGIFWNPRIISHTKLSQVETAKTLLELTGCNDDSKNLELQNATFRRARLINSVLPNSSTSLYFEERHWYYYYKLIVAARMHMYSLLFEVLTVVLVFFVCCAQGVTPMKKSAIDYLTKNWNWTNEQGTW